MKKIFTLFVALIFFYAINTSAQWCTPVVQPYGPTTPGITHFTLNDIDRSSAAIENSEDGYVLTDLSTTLVRGHTYNISITHTIDQVFCPDMNLRVWLDYNINYTLNDAGETVLTTDHHLAGTYSAAFTVPLTATLGVTRLRATAKMSNLGGHSLPTPCNFPLDPVGYHGEVEDYVITIAAETGVDDPLSIVNPISVYPNPSSYLVILSYSLSQSQEVAVELYSAIGKKELVVMNGEQNTGDYSYQLNLKSFSPGMYMIRMTTEEGTFTKQLMVTGE